MKKFLLRFFAKKSLPSTKNERPPLFSLRQEAVAEWSTFAKSLMIGGVPFGLLGIRAKRALAIEEYEEMKGDPGGVQK